MKWVNKTIQIVKEMWWIIWLITIIFLAIQTSLMNAQLKQDYNFRRLEFVSSINNNLGKEYSDIKYSLATNQYINNKEKLLSRLDQIEYLFDFYYRNKIISKEELSMFFKYSIINTCNNQQVATTAENSSRNGLKIFCNCIYESQIKEEYKLAYSTDCRDLSKK